MNEALVREFIEMVLELRSKKGGSSFGHKFNMKQFESLENTNMMLSYAQSFLEFLGKGSSRAAFILSNRYALKIALNQKGIAQNKTEVAVYTNPKTKSIIAKVHNADSEYKWLISDIVRPLQKGQEREFMSLTGLNWERFVKFLNDKNLAAFKGEPPQIAIAVKSTMEANNLLKGDIKEIDHWGKTPDGRLVLLDYGFTGEVWDEHYSDDAKREKEKLGNASTDVATAKPGNGKRDDSTRPAKPRHPAADAATKR